MTIENYKLEGTWGTSLLGGRAHVIVSAQYQDSPDTVYPQQRSWFQDTQLVNNPAYTATNGLPKLIHANNVGYAQATAGGVITANAAGTVAGSANALANIQFVGPAARRRPIAPATFRACMPMEARTIPRSAISIPLTVNFRNDRVRLCQLQDHLGYPGLGCSSITAKRVISPSSPAYKSAASQSRLTMPIWTPPWPRAWRRWASPPLRMGTLNTNNINLNNLTLSPLENSVGIPVNEDERTLYRGVFSLDGSLGR